MSSFKLSYSGMGTRRVLKSIGVVAIVAALMTGFTFAADEPTEPAKVDMSARQSAVGDVTSRSSDRKILTTVAPKSVTQVQVTPEAKQSATPTPAPTTPAPATPTPTAPKPKYPTALAKAAGEMYATTTLRVRQTPSAEGKQVGKLEASAKVAITAAKFGDWQQINYEGKPAWVSAKYLTKKPTTPAIKGIKTGKCTTSSHIVGRLTPRTRSVYQAVCATFPQVKSYGGYRPGAAAHGEGRAIDVMTYRDSDLGYAIANWARANARTLGISEVIYAQRIWTTQRASEGWRHMPDRGGRTANHYDHVHLTVRR